MVSGTLEEVHDVEFDETNGSQEEDENLDDVKVLTLDFGRFWRMTGGPACGKKGIRQTKQAVG